MNYGEDRDPYGAQMPYRIGYETYNPNYPAIPGVANSFSPQPPNVHPYMYPYMAGYHPDTNPHNQQSQNVSENTTPTVGPGITPTNSTHDYNLFYSRTGNNEHNTNDRATGPNHQAVQDPRSPQTGVSPWNTTPHNPPHAAGLGRPAVLPVPIGTRRPSSNGAEFGGIAGPRQSVGMDTRMNQGRPPSSRQKPAPVSIDTKQENVNWYLSTLPPSSTDMHADEMSRER